MKTFIERHASKIRGTLSCFDRVVITGTLPDICHAQAMAGFLSTRGIRLFDYRRWAEPLREELRAHAEQLAQTNGLKIEFIPRPDAFRKGKRLKALLAERGEHPGLVHIFSAMEPCPSFRPWHDKSLGRTCLKPTQGKCLHYYFYFIDPELGLCYLRVPTWAPVSLANARTPPPAVFLVNEGVEMLSSDPVQGHNRLPHEGRTVSASDQTLPLHFQGCQ